MGIPRMREDTDYEWGRISSEFIGVDYGLVVPRS